jgi:hypothetical protein
MRPVRMEMTLALLLGPEMENGGGAGTDGEVARVPPPGCVPALSLVFGDGDGEGDPPGSGMLG